MNVSIFSQKAYENFCDWTLGENKPNQTQFQLKNEANKPNQTQLVVSLSNLFHPKNTHSSPKYLVCSEILIIGNIWLLFLLI